MSEKRYAYNAWICSTCGGECIDIRTGLRCEHCGYDYRMAGMHRNAVFIPDPDYDEDYITEHGNDNS